MIQNEINHNLKVDLYNGCLIKSKITSSLGIVLDCETNNLFNCKKNTLPLVKVLFTNGCGNTDVVVVSKNIIETIC